MSLLIGAGVGAGAGALKYFDDLEREKRQRKLSAALMRNSPWTGMAPDPTTIQSPSAVGSVGQAGLAGAAFGQSVAQSDKLGGQTDKAGGMPLASGQVPGLDAQNPAYMPPQPGDYTSPWNQMPVDPNQQPHPYGYGYPAAPGAQPAMPMRPRSLWG